MANYPGRGAIINAYKPSLRIKSLEERNHVSNQGVIIKKEIEDILAQEKKIENLKREISLIREENLKFRTDMSEELSGSSEQRSEEVHKIDKATSELESYQSDLQALKSSHDEKKYEHMINSENIAKYKDEISILSRKKEKVARQCIVQKEKLKLKSEMNQETETILRKKLEERKRDLEPCEENIKSLDSTLEHLKGELKEGNDISNALQKDSEFLKNCEHLSNTLDKIEIASTKLVSNIELCKKHVCTEEDKFKQFCIEREKKILELAILEEKIRNSVQCESDQILTELREQEKEFSALKKLVHEI